MRLKTLEIQGFKSFADRTKFEFDDAITAIVGPNGCGKSNVIDAIRWVLGEQKTRNLRSDKMENIIFNGTEKRKKANLAEASITFDNDRNLLPSAYTTVTITRRLYRDGESEYLLNSVPCRLKDINHLFMDTGLGPDAYSIIELGMIEDMLNDKNNSRRALFEEAAGIAKYKSRRKETLSRLEEVDGSLNRVNDLLVEIDKNLKSLEKQAKRAEQYFVLKNEYKAASERLAYLKAAEYQTQLNKWADEEDKIKELIADLDVKIAGEDKNIAVFQEKLLKIEHESENLRRQYANVKEKIKAVETENEVRKERKKYIEKKIEELAGVHAKTQDESEKIRARLVELEGMIDAANEEHDKKEFYLAELETELDELKKSIENRRTALEETLRTLKSKENQWQNALRDRDRKQIQIESLLNEKKRFEKEEADALNRTGDLENRYSEKLKEAETAEQQYEALVRMKNEQDAALDSLNESLKDLRKKYAEALRRLDGKKNEYKILQDLVQNLEGFPEGVKYLRQTIFKNRPIPLVSDLFYTDEQYKTAIETYLEPYLNYYVVPDKATAVAAVESLKKSVKGRVNFLVLEDVSGGTLLQEYRDERLIYAPSVVEYASEYERLAQKLLGGVYISKSENADLSEFPNAVGVVHITGSVLFRQYIIGGGSVGLFEGKRLGRAKNLEKAEQQIRALQALADEIKAELDEKEGQYENLKSGGLDKVVKSAYDAKVKKAQELAVLESQRKSAAEGLEKFSRRKNEIEREIAELSQNMESRESAFDELRDECDRLRNQEERERKELQNKQSVYDEVNRKYNQENIDSINIQNAIKSLKAEYKAGKERIDNAAFVVENAQKEEAELRRELAEYEYQKSDDDDKLAALYEIVADGDKQLSAYYDELSEIRNAIKQAESNIRLFRNQKENAGVSREKNIEKRNEVKLKFAGLEERLRVEWQTELAQLTFDALFSDAEVPTNLPEFEAQVTKLRDRYLRFGEVNTTAIEAFNEMKERHDFISTQKKDLEDAKSALLETMREIDETAKSQFMDCFNAIRESFIKVFRTLFTEDDKCELELLNPLDPLESPIEISAQPKGKRPLTINQLSGGEKTLTAISLLFAIYLYKPAPFCIFDEVDAPLDDANIDKFNNIIRDFSGNSMFIIVTHNKRTMVKANRIFGVTMEETGVSRVLPVDLVALNLN